MESKGKILKFGSYSQKQLEQMKQDLNVSMPLSFLQHCAKYYRTQAKRDPSIDELKMLDRFTMAGIQSIASIAPTEVQTNDAVVAETYADMMQKRHALFPDSKLPMSLGEALGLATAYLSRAGKTISKERIYHLEKRSAYALLSKTESVTAENGICLHASSSCPQPRQSDDLFAVLLPLDGSYSTARYTELTEALWADAAFCQKIKGIRTVDESGLLGGLLAESDGVWIDLARLSQTGNEVPLSLLVDAYAGLLLVRIPREQEKEVYYLAKSHGIRSLIFATATKDSLYTVRRDANEAFSLDVRFLRSFRVMTPMRLPLQNEADGARIPAAQTPRTHAQCRYLDLPLRRPTTLTLSCQAMHLALASAPCRQAAFTNAFYTALLPVTNLALSGISYTEQTLAIGLSCSKEQPRAEVAGTTLSTILGLYRLQAELGMPASEIYLGEETLHDPATLAVFAEARDADPCPSAFLEVGHDVYCMIPKMQSNGLPEFASLRGLLEQLAKLRREGTLAAAAIICGTPLTDALLQMEADGKYCHLQNARFIAEDSIPFAILAETTAPVPGNYLGSVQQRVQEPTPAPENAPHLVPCHSLIWSEHPEMVLLAKGNDTDAHALAAILAQSGVTLHTFITDAPDALVLSKALLQSQTLLLCANAELPHTPQVQFALQTLRHAGGRVLTLGKSAPTVHGSVWLPKGLSPENLSILCEKEITF
ncbi:MAG: hypothetical protein IJX28_05290 [Clostridia bacterium]|nr:hypothetical protein [Clostridia bacterium]